MKRIAPVLLIVAAVVIFLAVKKSSDNRYVVYAKFKDAGGVLINYTVKIGEVKAGDVKKISLDKNDNAVIKMVMDKDAGKIGPGATASVRPVNLLGEKYVDLDPGDVNHPLKSGSTIQVDKTAEPVELDDALNTLNPDTRTAMRILINEAGVAMMGRGANLNETLSELPPALDQARRVVGEVADQNKALDSLAVQGDQVIASITNKRSNLNQLVTSAADALQTTSERRAKLGETVGSAPGGFSQLRSTLAQLQSASNQLTPAADDLRETAPSLGSTLARVPAFEKDAKATLKEAKSVAPSLSKLGRQSTAPLRRLSPTAQRLASFSTALDPLLKSLDDNGGLNDLLDFMDGWTGVTSQRDGLGHVFRLRAGVDRELVSGILSRYGAQQGITTRKKDAKTADAPAPSGGPAPLTKTPTTPAGTTPLPNLPDQLPGVVQQTLDTVQKVVDNTKKTVQSTVGKVTDAVKGATQQPQSSGGDSQNEISKALNYLLGP